MSNVNIAAVKAYLLALQDNICQQLEALDGKWVHKREYSEHWNLKPEPVARTWI